MKLHGNHRGLGTSLEIAFYLHGMGASLLTITIFDTFYKDYMAVAPACFANISFVANGYKRGLSG
jgi:hypothetical protein